MTVWRVWGEMYVEGDDIVAAVRQAADALDTVARHKGQHDWGWTISSMTPVSDQDPPVPARWVPPHLRIALSAASKEGKLEPPKSPSTDRPTKRRRDP